MNAIAETSHFIPAQDGLRLHVRDYEPKGATHSGDSARFPLLCLPGLTRTAADFETLARAIARGGATARRVLAMDYRGRGLSERDPDASHYAVPVEAADVIAALASLEIQSAIVVGSSRGGLIALTLAAMAPALLAGVVFNDVGPVVEVAGLIRIRSYAGRLTRPRDFHEAAAQQKMIFGAQFPALTDEEWMGMARRAWRDEDGHDENGRNESGRLAPTYDPAVARALDALDADTPLPELWELYDQLAATPLMAVRGEHSDILTRETVNEMARRRPDLDRLEVPGQGHTPLLADAPTIEAIAAFAARCDRAPAL